MNGHPEYRIRLTQATVKFKADLRKEIGPIITPILDFLTKIINKVKL